MRTRGSVTTYSVQEDSPRVPDYVPDSAATGTAWATGAKTSDGRISTTPNSNLPLTTILELAQSAGFRTGDVTTARITDATPAVLMSHVNDRGCEGPSDMATCPKYDRANGGPGSIATQAVDHGVDVLMGGGQDKFGQTIQAGPGSGQTVAQYATQSLGYTQVTTRDDANLDINYATALQGESQSHTGDEVPIFAKGPRSKRFRGIIEQTQIFSIMRNALRMPRTQNQSKTVQLK